MRKVALVILTLSMLGGGFAIIHGQSAQAAPTAVRDLATSQMLQLLPQPARYSIAAHSHHYRHMMGHNLHRSRAGLHLMSLNAGVPDPMCEDCGGNHPLLYSTCDRCQEGALAACLDQHGFYASCSCKCGYLNRCLWIRW